MYRLNPRHLIMVGILFFAASFTLGHLLPRTPLYHLLDLVWGDDHGHSDGRLWREWHRECEPAGDLPAGCSSTNRHLFGFPGRFPAVARRSYNSVRSIRGV